MGQYNNDRDARLQIRFNDEIKRKLVEVAQKKGQHITKLVNDELRKMFVEAKIVDKSNYS